MARSAVLGVFQNISVEAIPSARLTSPLASLTHSEAGVRSDRPYALADLAGRQLLVQGVRQVESRGGLGGIVDGEGTGTSSGNGEGLGQEG